MDFLRLYFIKDPKISKNPFYMIYTLDKKVQDEKYIAGKKKKSSQK